MSTIQLDFAAKKRFGLSYTDDTSKENNEVFVIHRAPLSTHERFMAFLIEHYAGVWPVWLSPVQVQCAPVSSKYLGGVQAMAQEFRDAGIRVGVDESDETVGNKVRKAVEMKIPYILVVGERELSGDMLSVRIRGKEQQETMSREAFVERVKGEIRERV